MGNKSIWVVRDSYQFKNGKRFEPIARLTLPVAAKHPGEDYAHLEILRELSPREKYQGLSYKEGMYRAKVLAAAPDLLELAKRVVGLSHMTLECGESCGCEICQLVRGAKEVVSQVNA